MLFSRSSVCPFCRNEPRASELPVTSIHNSKGGQMAALLFHTTQGVKCGFHDCPRSTAETGRGVVNSPPVFIPMLKINAC